MNPAKPEFIDNRGDNTLVEALRTHLAWLAETYARSVELSIATGYFNPQGFALIADHLEQLPRVRLLLGAEPLPPPMRPLRKPGDPKGDRFEARLVRQALQASHRGVVRDRNHLPFAEEVDRSVHRLVSVLESGSLEVRRYERGFLHGKAFIFADDEGVIAGSSNFTAAGLTTNLELNLGRYDPTPVAQVKQWFDDLWDEAEPYDLASAYRARYLEYDPYLIYLRVLWELYHEEMEQERTPDGRIPLTTFQNDGLFRAKRILEKYNGVLIADGVGLGKTYIGGELISEGVHDRRQRVLLVCPAALRDGTWKTFADRYALYIESVSYEQLSRDSQLGGEESYLSQPIQDYALVVIDEAQAFRNPSRVRAQALRRLLRGEPPKKLVLLTATPVNNSLWDLYYLLTYFVGHDAVFSDRGILSLKKRFEEAMAQDPYELSPDVLFDILDTVTVRRTRHFVRKYYPHDRIEGPGGQMMPIRFPEPHVYKVNYELDDVLPDFFDEFTEKVAPEHGEPALTMARYWPSRYRIGAKPDAREIALVGLLRSALLKRFESSVYAFAQTADMMAKKNQSFLQALDMGFVISPEAIEEWTETDSDESLEALLEEARPEPTEGYDVERLRADVDQDSKILEDFATKAAGVTRENDPKLAKLMEELVDIAAQAEREGIDEQDVRDKRKVIIFSYFVDTIDWIEDFLLPAINRDERLASYRDRIASVTGADSRRGISRSRAVLGFAPRSTEAPPGQDEDRFDILITTDVLAEGMNLQQCRNVINYDLPWNPMRLVQRDGRIDRIASPHSDVYLRCFFPDKRLDDLLDLETRVRRKLAQAAASIGVETEVIPRGATSEVVFSETRDEIEALRNEDATLLKNAGEDPSAHSGEEYRQELRKGLEVRGAEITNLPWAAGSGFIGRGERGHFFCARVGERVFLRFVPEEGEDLVRDTLGCLSRIACSEQTERYIAPDLAERAYSTWERARKDIYDEWTFATDPANLQPYIRPLFREIASHLRDHPPPNVNELELSDVLDAVEAPWGLRIERQLREVFYEESLDARSISAGVVDKVRELGLRPYRAPAPLPEIDEEDAQLVCWMAVEMDAGGAERP